MKKVLLSAALALATLVPAASAADVFVRVGPPAPRRDVMGVRPGSRYVWRPGYYNWTGGRYVWAPGRWMLPPRPHAVWVPGYWSHRRGGYAWVGGYWR